MKTPDDIQRSLKRFSRFGQVHFTICHLAVLLTNLNKNVSKSFDSQWPYTVRPSMVQTTSLIGGISALVFGREKNAINAKTGALTVLQYSSVSLANSIGNPIFSRSSNIVPSEELPSAGKSSLLSKKLNNVWRTISGLTSVGHCASVIHTVKQKIFCILNDILLSRLARWHTRRTLTSAWSLRLWVGRETSNRESNFYGATERFHQNIFAEFLRQEIVLKAIRRREFAFLRSPRFSRSISSFEGNSLLKNSLKEFFFESDLRFLHLCRFKESFIYIHE